MRALLNGKMTAGNFNLHVLLLISCVVQINVTHPLSANCGEGENIINGRCGKCSTAQFFNKTGRICQDYPTGHSNPNQISHCESDTSDADKWEPIDRPTTFSTNMIAITEPPPPGIVEVNQETVADMTTLPPTRLEHTTKKRYPESLTTTVKAPLPNPPQQDEMDVPHDFLNKHGSNWPIVVIDGFLLVVFLLALLALLCLYCIN